MSAEIIQFVPHARRLVASDNPLQGHLDWCRMHGTLASQNKAKIGDSNVIRTVDGDLLYIPPQPDLP